MKGRSLNLWSKTRRCPKEPNHEGKILDSWRDTRRHPHYLPKMSKTKMGRALT